MLSPGWEDLDRYVDLLFSLGSSPIGVNPRPIPPPPPKICLLGYLPSMWNLTVNLESVM